MYGLVRAFANASTSEVTRSLNWRQRLCNATCQATVKRWGAQHLSQNDDFHRVCEAWKLNLRSTIRINHNQSYNIHTWSMWINIIYIYISIYIRGDTVCIIKTIYNMDPGWGWYALTLRVSYMIVILAISCDVFHLAMRVGGWLPVSALCPVELCQVTKEWNSASRKRAGLWCQATCCVTCWQGNRWNLNLHEPPMWEWVWTTEIYWDYPNIL